MHKARYSLNIFLLNFNYACDVHQVKVKVTLEQAMKVQRGSRDIVLLFLQPRHWMRVGDQLHAPAALPPGMTRYPL
jgi:hypothetical protein